MKPTGTWATLVLPIRADESIDFERLRAELECIARSGVSGVYSNGTAGEFYAQSETEFDRIHECMAGICREHGLPFQIGANHTSAQTTLGRIRRAREWAPSAFQIILPDWAPLANEEAVRFLRGAAGAAGDIPLVLYNPPHAKRVLEPADFAELAEAVPELTGLKVGGGDDAWYDAMRPLFDRLSVFVPGHTLASGYARGAHGSYSNVAGLNPAGAARWFRLMQNDLPAALALETRIVRFFEDHLFPLRAERSYCNHAFDKLLAAIGGWADIGTRLRWPYNWFPPETAERLRPVAREALPELFDPPNR